MEIKTLKDLKEFENSCIYSHKPCTFDYCRNVGGRCYYMAVVSLFHNIKSQIIY